MRKYFKFVGVVTLILFIVAGILQIVVLAETVDYLEGAALVISIFELIIFFVFGPAMGLLFISYSNHLEEHSHERQKFSPKPTPVQTEFKTNTIPLSANTPTKAPSKSTKELGPNESDISDIAVVGSMLNICGKSIRLSLISEVTLNNDNIEITALGTKYKNVFSDSKEGYALYQKIKDNYMYKSMF